MKTINLKERTNQRDGTVFALEYQDSTPLCPHCEKPMVKVGDCWENAMCPCWWQGMQDGVYAAQVVVADTSEQEFEYRTQCAEVAEQLKVAREDDLMKARLRYATATAEGKFIIVHQIRHLYGKRKNKIRNRVREVIARSGTFDEAMSA